MLAVVVKLILQLQQLVHGALGLCPDIGGRRERVLDLVLVLLELERVLLDLFQGLRNRLQGRDCVLRHVGGVKNRNAGGL